MWPINARSWSILQSNQQSLREIEDLRSQEKEPSREILGAVTLGLWGEIGDCFFLLLFIEIPWFRGSHES